MDFSTAQSSHGHRSWPAKKERELQHDAAAMSSVACVGLDTLLCKGKLHL